jgi:hypothetical protein
VAWRLGLLVGGRYAPSDRQGRRERRRIDCEMCGLL